MPKKKTTEQFISEAIKVHGRKYSYDECYYTGALKKCTITCPFHGNFEQRPSDHLSGRGCPVCHKDSVKPRLEKVLPKLKELHNCKYDYKEILTYKGKTYIVYDCPEHGEIRQILYNHINRGSGCNKCAYKVRRKSLAFTLEDFISKSKERHNNKYSYELVSSYYNNRDTVEIICPQHGVFSQKAYDHLAGYGCPSCAVDSSRKYDQDSFIDKSKQVHGDTYDYSVTEFVSVNKSVDIMCPIHGVFRQCARSHMRGQGCPVCADKYKGRYFNIGHVERNKDKLIKDIGNLYVLRIQSDENIFFKIGVSKNVSARVNTLRLSSGLKIDIVHEREMNRFFSYLLEFYIHDLLKDKFFFSGHKFDGYTECFGLTEHEVDALVNDLDTMEEYVVSRYRLDASPDEVL